MKKLLKVVGMVLMLAGIAMSGAALYVKFALPDVGEASDLLVLKTPERIKRGKYLANHVAVCMDCHSTRDWSLFSAPPASTGLGGGGEVFNREMGFPGVFHAKNITPYAIGSWTDGELFRGITTGETKEGKALFPVMPYLNYGQLDKEDIFSIIAYIRTLASVETTISATVVDFPFSILINTMPDRANFTKIPSQTDLVNYGRYMATAAGCVDCHSMREKGRILPGSEFGGGMEFSMAHGITTSANITADKVNGIGSWTADQFVRRFKMYADSGYRPHRVEKGFNTPMPWTMYAGMEEADLRAIYAYLQTVKPLATKIVKYRANP